MYRYTAFKDHVTLRDYEINDGMVGYRGLHHRPCTDNQSLEMY